MPKLSPAQNQQLQSDFDSQNVCFTAQPEPVILPPPLICFSNTFDMKHLNLLDSFRKKAFGTFQVRFFCRKRHTRRGLGGDGGALFQGGVTSEKESA